MTPRASQAARQSKREMKSSTISGITAMPPRTPTSVSPVARARLRMNQLGTVTPMAAPTTAMTTARPMP